jgi:hypothetical protein
MVKGNEKWIVSKKVEQTQRSKITTIKTKALTSGIKRTKNGTVANKNQNKKM